MRSISTAWAHRSTARRARRGAHTRELQHDTVRYSQDNSTARTAPCTCERAAARHQTTARRARRSAHSGERKHGAVRYSHATARDARRSAHTGELQHGAVRYIAPATHRPQHGTHGAVRTPGSYSTAQCATTPQQCTMHAPARALQDTAGHRATRARLKHTRDRDAPHTLAWAWRTRRRAIGLRSYGYLDPRGHWELED
jgi:hypothetical protein